MRDPIIRIDRFNGVRSMCLQPTRYRRYRRLATSWNAIRAANVRRSVARTAFVRRLVHRTYRPCRFAVVTDRHTITNASSGCTLVATRRTWSRRPLATAEVGSLNVRRTGRLIFCITKLPVQRPRIFSGEYNWIQLSEHGDSIVLSMNISFPSLVHV